MLKTRCRFDSVALPYVTSSERNHKLTCVQKGTTDVVQMPQTLALEGGYLFASVSIISTLLVALLQALLKSLLATQGHITLMCYILQQAGLQARSSTVVLN